MCTSIETNRVRDSKHPTKKNEKSHDNSKASHSVSTQRQQPSNYIHPGTIGNSTRICEMQDETETNCIVLYCVVHIYLPFTSKRIVSLYFGREVSARLGVAISEMSGPPVFHIKAEASL